MKKKINKKDNFLELIPRRNSSKEWILNDDGRVQIIIPRNGLFDKVVRVFYKTPKVMRIDLDELGSAVWKLIDGKRNISDIGVVLKAEYGDKAEPLIERLGKYINILRNNKFIIIEKAAR